MWFAALPGAEPEPWLLRLVARLLEGDPAVRGLLAPGAFPDHPPRWIRARYYRYTFTRPGEGTAAWWRRVLVRDYLPPLSREGAGARAGFGVPLSAQGDLTRSPPRSREGTAEATHPPSD
jgi:hypothetical protein